MGFFEMHCCLFYSNDRNLYSQVELDVFKWYKNKILTVKIIPIPLTISGIPIWRPNKVPSTTNNNPTSKSRKKI